MENSSKDESTFEINGKFIKTVHDNWVNIDFIESFILEWQNDEYVIYGKTNICTYAFYVSKSQEKAMQKHRNLIEIIDYNL